MGKVLGGLGIAATGAAASAGAIYLSRKANFDSTLPEELATFEKDGHTEGCVAKLFPELEKIAAEAEIGDTDKVESNFFGSNDEDKKQTESCLVINWNKQEFGTEKKWKGNFRFLWTAKNEKAQKGFVVFAVATPTSGKKFKWIGVAYSMAKDKDK